MNWGSAQTFFEMGGYGLYVWGSYGVTALCIVLEVYFLRRRRILAQVLGKRRRLLNEGDV